MDKELVLAVAGSGKTYDIANRIKENEKNLIFTFNVSNVENVRNEIIDRFGYIPDSTVVMTFHSFRYKYFIKPNQYNLMNDMGIELKGIDIITSPPPRPNPKMNIYNKNYIKDDKIEHYVVNDRVYSDYMSKFIMKGKLYNRAKSYINMFFDSIYVDEFQDFEYYDYDILKELYKCDVNLYLYGDYYQAGVSYSCTMNKRPYSKSDNEYQKYLNTIESDFKSIKIDKESLCKSRRCGKNVTDLINEKFGSDIIYSKEINDTKIAIEEITDIKDLSNKIGEMTSNNYIFLVWDKSVANKYKIEKYVTWSKSKGDTYDNVCVILTKAASKFIKGQDPLLDKTSVNKLYVALTRATNSIVIIDDLT